MFDNLSDKLQRVFKNLRGEGKLSAANMEAAPARDPRGLLEADVNFKVVKQLIEAVKEKAMGEEVLSSLSPTQQVVKIVRDELTRILGSHQSKLRFANEPPQRHPDCRIAGIGQNHLDREARPLAFEERP
jgi:signal recognition particle subunit SRP54